MCHPPQDVPSFPGRAPDVPSSPGCAILLRTGTGCAILPRMCHSSQDGHRMCHPPQDVPSFSGRAPDVPSSPGHLQPNTPSGASALTPNPDLSCTLSTSHGTPIPNAGEIRFTLWRAQPHALAHLTLCAATPYLKPKPTPAHALPPT